MRLRRILLVLLILAGLFVAICYRNARADPLVRTATVALPDWPAGAKPVRIALVSDIHLESAAMDGARLGRIVALVNAQHADLIVLAGDFIAGRDANEPKRVGAVLAANLKLLQAPLGTVAVLGNHDYWTDGTEVHRLLRSVGIIVLRNQATRTGPLAIGGLDDDATHHDRLDKVMAALDNMPGGRIMIAHSPEIARTMLRERPVPAGLLLAGHTHCGQVVLPLIGAPVNVVGARYTCGIVRDAGLTTIVTAGVGTSNLPLRFGAPPDIWLVTVGPAAPR